MKLSNKVSIAYNMKEKAFQNNVSLYLKIQHKLKAIAGKKPLSYELKFLFFYCLLGFIEHVACLSPESFNPRTHPARPKHILLVTIKHSWLLAWDISKKAE